MSYRVEWTETALARAQELGDFIARKDVAAARRAIAKLFDGVRMLSNSPRLGKAHPRTNDPNVRRLIVADYVVIYRVSDEKSVVNVLTVRHGREKPFHVDELERE